MSFFLEYINQLHDEMLTAHAATSWPSAERPVIATQLHFDAEMQKNLVCVNCQDTREVHERFRDFSLDFPGSMDTVRVSLQSMLSSYFASEVLEANCPKCNAVAAHMGKVLTSLPRVLVLHLKRFVPNLQEQRYDKQHKSVDIPIRLDLQSCLDRPDGVRLPARPWQRRWEKPQVQSNNVQPRPLDACMISGRSWHMKACHPNQATMCAMPVVHRVRGGYMTMPMFTSCREVRMFCKLLVRRHT